MTVDRRIGALGEITNQLHRGSNLVHKEVRRDELNRLDGVVEWTEFFDAPRLLTRGAQLITEMNAAPLDEASQLMLAAATSDFAKAAAATQGLNGLLRERLSQEADRARAGLAEAGIEVEPHPLEDRR